MKTLKKFSALLLCLALVFGAFGITASAAGSSMSDRIRSFAFPEEFQTCKMLMYNGGNYELDTGVYPAYIEFTLSDGSVVKVENEMNEYGVDAGFSGTLNAFGAARKVTASYTDYKEGERIVFSISVDGADVYCEEAKLVYSQTWLDFLMLQVKIINDISRIGFSDPVALMKLITDDSRDFTEYRSAILSQGYSGLSDIADLVIFNLKYDIRNIKNILTGQLLAELFK